jgi:hypothetical protein
MSVPRLTRFNAVQPARFVTSQGTHGHRFDVSGRPLQDTLHRDRGRFSDHGQRLDDPAPVA